MTEEEVLCTDCRGTDLFGAQPIERSAEMHGLNCRLKLIMKWGPGPIACVIGHNPSNADGEKDDPTSRWWNRWFRAAGFGGYVALNLYPWRSADPREVYEIMKDINGGLDWGAHDELHFANLANTLVGTAKNAHQVFVCFGAIARDKDWIEHVVEQIQSGEAPYPDLWCWGKTGSGAPKHPLARGKHRIPTDQPAILWRAA